jgi:hypothetical protein
LINNSFIVKGKQLRHYLNALMQAADPIHLSRDGGGGEWLKAAPVDTLFWLNIIGKTVVYRASACVLRARCALQGGVRDLPTVLTNASEKFHEMKFSCCEAARWRAISPLTEALVADAAAS